MGAEEVDVLEVFPVVGGNFLSGAGGGLWVEVKLLSSRESSGTDG